MVRDVRYHFPRAWLRREGENYLAKDEVRGLFRGSRVTLLERERRLDGACLRSRKISEERKILYIAASSFSLFISQA